MFTEMRVRPYKPSDLQQVIEIYKAAFAEPPWNETWTDGQVKEDLEFALSQELPIVLVAEDEFRILGMSWGYKLPFEKYPFLRGVVNNNSSYMDEMAVKKDVRRKGIAKALGKGYLEVAKTPGVKEVALRTDIWNFPAMATYRSLGFESLGIFDPTYKDRLYLTKKIGGER